MEPPSWDYREGGGPWGTWSFWCRVSVHTTSKAESCSLGTQPPCCEEAQAAVKRYVEDLFPSTALAQPPAAVA